MITQFVLLLSRIDLLNLPGVDVGVSDATGIYRIENIDPGTYQIRVEYGINKYDVAGVEIIIGQNELNIAR